MADQQSRGDKKQGATGGQREEHQGVAAPVDKRQPGHALDDQKRQQAQKEINERDRAAGRD